METVSSSGPTGVHNPSVILQTPDGSNRTASLNPSVVVKSENVARAVSAAGATATPSNVLSSMPQSSSLSTVKPDARLLDKRRIGDLLKEVDPLEQLDEDVEELLAQIADDFIDNVVTSACQLARHRKSGTVEVKDVQLHLERHWNMWIPGFGSEELRPYKKQATTEAHRQRLALIKKTLKKS